MNRRKELQKAMEQEFKSLEELINFCELNELTKQGEQIKLVLKYCKLAWNKDYKACFPIMKDVEKAVKDWNIEELNWIYERHKKLINKAREESLN